MDNGERSASEETIDCVEVSQGCVISISFSGLPGRRIAPCARPSTARAASRFGNRVADPAICYYVANSYLPTQKPRGGRPPSPPPRGESRLQSGRDQVRIQPASGSDARPVAAHTQPEALRCRHEDAGEARSEWAAAGARNRWATPGIRALMLRLDRELGPLGGCRWFRALQIRSQGRGLHVLIKPAFGVDRRRVRWVFNAP